MGVYGSSTSSASHASPGKRLITLACWALCLAPADKGARERDNNVFVCSPLTLPRVFVFSGGGVSLESRLSYLLDTRIAPGVLHDFACVEGGNDMISSSWYTSVYPTL